MDRDGTGNDPGEGPRVRPTQGDPRAVPAKPLVFFLGTCAQDRDESLGVGARFIDLAHDFVPEYFYNSGGG